MAEAVLDASAVLALIFDEPGGNQVAQCLPEALISTVNVAEVATRLYALDMPGETVESIFSGLQLPVVPFDYSQALATAELHPVTRSAGLSLGDRACLALASARGVPAVTADSAWHGVASEAGVVITLIR